MPQDFKGFRRAIGKLLTSRLAKHQGLDVFIILHQVLLPKALEFSGGLLEAEERSVSLPCCAGGSIKAGSVLLNCLKGMKPRITVGDSYWLR